MPRANAQSLLRIIIYGCGIGLLLGAGAEAARVAFGGNFHTVLPGRVYRCAQRSPAGLRRTVEKHDIRTVVNLRGCCAPLDWYLDEARATADLDVAQEDICLSAGRLPSVHEMRRLVEVLDRTEYPILLHCRQGADRTGLVSAAVLLLLTDTEVAAARRQLGLRYGHVALGRPAHLDRFFDLYEEWLGERGLQHSRAAFRQWIEKEYCPGECRCEFEVLDAPASVPKGKPWALRVRACNTSVKTWHLHPGNTAGVHALWAVCDPQNHLVAQGRAGLFRADVAPGEHIDLTVALPALRQAGRYSVIVDMTDEQHCEFYKTGSEPLLLEVEVRDEREH